MRRLRLVLVTAAAVAVPVAPVYSQAVVDTLNASPETTFSLPGSGGQPVYAGELGGPRFTLTKTSRVLEIGAFLATFPTVPGYLPFVVQIRHSVDGLPDPSGLIATFVLSDDQNQDVISYESVRPGYVLPPGEYFALFSSQRLEDGGYILGNTSTGYLAGQTYFGFWQPETGIANWGLPYAAVRILAEPFVRTVTLEITPKVINPGANGLIRVAILSARGFSAVAETDRTSLTFGKTGDEVSRAFCNPKGVDVNGDGHPDLVCFFRTSATGLTREDSQAVLKGRLLSDMAIVGTATFRQVCALVAN